MNILITGVMEGHPTGGVLAITSEKKRDKADKKYIKRVKKAIAKGEDSIMLDWDILGEISFDLFEPYPFTGTIDGTFSVYDDS
jgi:hypothetical protein